MLHFTTRASWVGAQSAGEYRSTTFSVEGFIHLSFGHQLARVATAIARGATDLVLLVVDPSHLGDALRVEGGFPHLYGPIPLESIRLAVDFPPEADGSFQIPEPARLAELAIAADPSADSVLGRTTLMMKGFASPWWIGGGWAIDAAVGSLSRPHLDLDILIVRRDVLALGRHLAGWDLRIPLDGLIPNWDGTKLDPADHQVWARPDEGYRPDRWQDFALDPGFVDFLIEETDAEGMWVYRRERSIRAPIERLGPPSGFLQPEVALLYKATAATGGDHLFLSKAETDFDHALPHLRPDQRAWLRGALQLANPGHPWIDALA